MISEGESHIDFHRELIQYAVDSYGFEELSELKTTSNDFEEMTIKTTQKGVFKSKDNYMGIFCKFVNQSSLKAQLKKCLTNRFKVENIYEGEKYLLCLSNKKIYSFDINNYRIILSIINSIDYEFHLANRTHLIGVDNDSKLDILIIETEIADFAIAGLRNDSQEEEERVILSNKLEGSQPFFKFKSPIHFNWEKLIGDKDRQFERICELLLQKEKNISRIIPIGKTRASDRGRDFEVIEKIDSISEIKERKWLVQCKYSESSISPSKISGWTDRIIEHHYYGYWLMTNNDITPTLFDQFKDVEKNLEYNIKIKFWQRSDFYVKLNVHSEVFINGDIFERD